MKFLIKEVEDFNECQYNGIPKIVHLIWVGKEKPYYLNEQIESWNKFLDKEWSLELHDDTSLLSIKENSDDFGKKIFKMAESMPEMASYVDIIRLYILYTFGGYYFDADFQIFRDIEPFTHINSDLIISNSTTAYYPYVDNCFFGCTEKHAFLKYCLDKLIEKFEQGNMENDWIIRRTGPIFVGYSMINFDGFEKIIKCIPRQYLYSNEKDDDIIIRNEKFEIEYIKQKETFNGRFGRHMFVGNNNYETFKDTQKEKMYYFPKQNIKYTKDYNDECVNSINNEIGDYTYGHPHVVVYEGEIGKVKIGKFCSISNYSTFFVNGYHNVNCITKYPFSVFKESGMEEFKDIEYDKANIPQSKDIIIGNDVYIGEGAVIMGGVKIGDGAVVASNSVVCNDVEPYEIVGGNPAKHIKYIFSPEQIKSLLEIAWWDWDFEKIKENCKYITSENIDLFIEKFGNKNE